MKLFEGRGDATLKEVSWLRKALRRQFAQLRLAPDIADEVVLAAAELATNIVRHADPPAGTLALEADLDGVVLTLTLTDDGGPFTGFTERWTRARLAAADPEGAGGRGLALARALLDQAEYRAGPPNRLVARRQLARRRPQLLVVEDEPLLLETYLGILEPHYRVLPAENLRGALALARQTKVDLILTDFHLGSEPGTALLEALENDADRPPIPIVMITGDPSVRLRVLELGVDTFLTKPVVPAALLETTKLALGRAARERARLFRYFGSALDHLVRPVLPERLGPFAAALRWETADIGGGDLVVHLPRAGRDRVVLVDVMGHGIDAKAGAVAHAAMIRALDSGNALGPGPFLERWSSLIFNEAAFDPVIATALVADLNADGSVEIASAGHPRPMLVSHAGVGAVEVDGPLLGFTDQARYPSVRFTLEEGQRLLLATDGLDAAELASGGPCPHWLTDELRARQAAPIDNAARRAANRIAARLGPDPHDDWVLILIERAQDNRPAQSDALPRMAVHRGAGSPGAPPPSAAAPPRAASEEQDRGGDEDRTGSGDGDGDGGLAPLDIAVLSARLPCFESAGIAALRKAVGEEAFLRLATRFLGNIGERLAEWDRIATAGGPLPALVTSAHALAGLFGQFGLGGASALAREVENEADDGMRLALARLLAPLAGQELSCFKAWLTDAAVSGKA